jgi:hypothetical protein
MRLQRRWILFLLPATLLASAGSAQTPQNAPAPSAQTLAQKPGSVIISLDDAIRLAFQHNHSLLAARSTIQQSQAEGSPPISTALWISGARDFRSSVKLLWVSRSARTTRKAAFHLCFGWETRTAENGAATRDPRRLHHRGRQHTQLAVDRSNSRR